MADFEAVRSENAPSALFRHSCRMCGRVVQSSGPRIRPKNRSAAASWVIGVNRKSRRKLGKSRDPLQTSAARQLLTGCKIVFLPPDRSLLNARSWSLFTYWVTKGGKHLRTGAEGERVLIFLQVPYARQSDRRRIRTAIGTRAS